MHNEKEHIDKLLSDVMTDATMDAPGIDWDAFNGRRKRKKAILLWSMAAGVLLLAVSTWSLIDYLNSDTEPVQLVTESTRVDGTETVPSKQESETDIISNNQQTKTDLEETAEQRDVHEEFNVSTPSTNSSPKRVKIITHNEPKPHVVKPPVSTIENKTNRTVELVVMQPRRFTQFQYDLKLRLGNIPDTIIGQNPVFGPSVEPLSKTFVKLGFGPTLTNPTLVLNQQTQHLVHKDYSSVRNQGEQNAVGFYMSGMVGKRINRWSPFVGLGLSHNTVLADYQFEYSEKPIRDIDGSIIGYQNRTAETVKFGSNHSYSLIDIPVGAEYTLKNNAQASLSLVGQVSPQILFSVQGVLPNPVFLNEQNSLSTSDFKLNSLTGYAGISYARRIGNMEWYIEPKYAYNVGLQQVSDLYNTRFNMIVVTFGIKK